MHIAEIKHYQYISNRLVSSGQPEVNQFDVIAKAAYQVVINLATVDSIGAVVNEAQIVETLGMTYIHIPVPFDAPKAHHLIAFFEAMREHEGKKVWVHCALNYRASAFLYHYHCMVLNQAEAEAKQILLPSWQPNTTWQQFLRLSKDVVL